MDKSGKAWLVVSCFTETKRRKELTEVPAYEEKSAP
jgi:hypothetical protein